MTSPSPGLELSSSDVLEQWRSGGGEHLTYSEVAWTGAACALIGVAILAAGREVVSLARRLLA